MEYLVDLPPDECLDSAMRYLLNRGYSVESRTETMLVMSRRPELRARDMLLIMVGALFTFGLTLLLILLLALIKWKATVLAMPAPEGDTLLTLSSTSKKVSEALRKWVEEELCEKARPLP